MRSKRSRARAAARQILQRRSKPIRLYARQLFPPVEVNEIVRTCSCSVTFANALRRAARLCSSDEMEAFPEQDHSIARCALGPEAAARPNSRFISIVPINILSAELHAARQSSARCLSRLQRGRQAGRP